MNFLKGKEVIGEITIIIKGIKRVEKSQEYNKLELRRELIELIGAGLTLSKASRYLAKKNNVSKSIIYNMY